MRERWEQRFCWLDEYFIFIPEAIGTYWFFFFLSWVNDMIKAIIGRGIWSWYAAWIRGGQDRWEDNCHRPCVSAHRPDLGACQKGLVAKDENIIFNEEEELVWKEIRLFCVCVWWVVSVEVDISGLKAGVWCVVMPWYWTVNKLWSEQKFLLTSLEQKREEMLFGKPFSPLCN